MNYCKSYCEKKEISTSKLNEAQRTLHYIAENMRMNKSISKERYKHFQMAIQALEQEPKTGHWIMTGDYYTGAYDSIDYVECSCCHKESLEEGSYCPNCGARMEDEE